jgi:hypothetical protein
VCGVVEVTGPATETFTAPATWTAAQREKFSVKMPVKLLWKCRADVNAPSFRAVHDKHPGHNYMKLEDFEAHAFITAIKRLAV